MKAILALLLASVTTAVHAQSAGFDAADYGQARLPVRQSTGDAAALIAASKGGAFEPIGELAEGDALRRLARPVGRIDVVLRDAAGKMQGTSCTGALLGGGLVLTNHHCLPQSGPLTPLKASILMDYLRLDGAGSQRFELDPEPVDFDAALDFAVLRVSGAPAEAFGHVRVGPVPAGTGAGRTVMQHPLGSPKMMARFRCLTLADRSSAPTVAHRCDTLPGSSGSLMFDGRGVGVALHHAGGLNPADATSFNAAIDMAAILAKSEAVAGSPAASASNIPVASSPADPLRPPADPLRQTAPGTGGLSTDEVNDVLRGN